MFDLSPDIDLRLRFGRKRAKGPDHQLPYIAAAVFIQDVIILLQGFYEPRILVLIKGKQGSFSVLWRFYHLELPLLRHGENAECERLSLLLFLRPSEKEPGPDIRDREGDHRHEVLIVCARLLEHRIELIPEIQLVRIPVLKFCIFGIAVLQLLPDLPYVLHDLPGRNHLRELFKAEVRVDDPLTPLRLNERHEHFQEIIVQIEMHRAQHIFRDPGGLFLRIDDTLRRRIKKGIDRRVKLLEELPEASDEE